MAGERRIAVGIAERADREARARPLIFRRRLGDDAGGQDGLGIAIAPLSDVIFLHAVDGGLVPPAGTGEAAHVGDMDRREIGRELDDHSPAVGEVHDQQIVGIDRPPVRGGRGGDHLRRLGRARHRRRPPGGGGGSALGAGGEEDEGGEGGELAHERSSQLPAWSTQDARQSSPGGDLIPIGGRAPRLRLRLALSRAWQNSPLAGRGALPP